MGGNIKSSVDSGVVVGGAVGGKHIVKKGMK